MSSGDSFWTSSWGRVIRQLGVYAAGVIPFVGALAGTVVKYADSYVFAAKTKREPVAVSPPKPAPTPAAQARVVNAQDALFLTRSQADELSGLPYFPSEPTTGPVILPGPGSPNGQPPAPSMSGTGRGFSDFLQSVSGGPMPGVGFYVALGAVVIFALYIMLRGKR